MKLTKQFTVNASADCLWEIMGTQFADISNWASGVYASQGHYNGAKLQGAPYSGRICETSIGTLKEQILIYDDQNKTVSYDAKSAQLPFFVTHMVNTWTFTPLAKGQCKGEMNLEISLLPLFSLIMGPIMKMRVGGAIAQTIEELTHVAEHEEIHPRKLESQQKLQPKST
ncbi:MAG: SRPBCC family protein [Cyanobacteria bacterium P01_F01_bin.150]